jgi:glutathione S-transferase
VLTLWGRLNSHNVKKVAWLAEEIGRPWRRIDIGGQFGFTDAYLAMNPNRMIPTIEDDGLVLWESNAILRYLAAKYAPELWPEDPAERARGDKWMDWQFHFADAQRDAFLELVRVAPENRNQEAINRSTRASIAMMGILEAELAGRPWLSGETFGIADIPMGVYTHTFFTLPFERPALPALEAWYRRLKARPGFAHVTIPLT